MKGEKGQVLPLVLVAVMLGTLVVTPFVSHAGTGMMGSRLFGQALNEQYAADSGVEHAIWRLTDDGLADILDNPGDSTGYSLSEAVNGVIPAITVSNGWETIASDDFESGGWSGGTGWLTDWEPAGDASIVTTGGPYQGSYHLMLRRDTGYVQRSINVRGPAANLQFWAKVSSLEAGESARCLVSPDGTNWTAVQTWANGDDDNIYHSYDIDLSSYGLTRQFWIAFESNASGTGDQLYVDDLKVLWIVDTAVPFASDDFETGTWSGGTGWLTDWAPAGDASIVTTGGTYQGIYHLRLRADTGYASRSVDLSSRTEAYLQFYAKANSFEAGETSECLVSENGTDWTPVYTWVNGDDDDVYHFFNIDLSPFTLTSEFWIAFRANMSGTGDYFYVDDLKISGPPSYAITARAGDVTVKAVVRLSGGEASLLDWWVR